MINQICCNSEYHFADTGKMIACGKRGMPKMKLDGKDAGGLLGEK